MSQYKPLENLHKKSHKTLQFSSYPFRQKAEQVKKKKKRLYRLVNRLAKDNAQQASPKASVCKQVTLTHMLKSSLQKFMVRPK